MQYAIAIIPPQDIPRAACPIFQHVVDTYASETNKVYATWLCFSAAEMEFRPHERSAAVGEIMRHELLSERRFFAEFLGLPEAAAEDVLPPAHTPEAFAARLGETVRPRLAHLAIQNETWWLTERQFFDVRRQRIWVFWRRVLHTAHHRTQLAVYLRLLNKPVPAIYGPTADATWPGADPTLGLESAARKNP